jgi:DNA-binding NtrC family response regulator
MGRIMGHRRVLVLDDEATLRSTLIEFLEGQGYEASSAPDSRSGVELASIESPQVILLDFDMPRVNGLDAILALQSASPEAKIIVITGSACPDLAEKMYRRGAFDFLAKPLDYHALGNSLESALALETPGA